MKTVIAAPRQEVTPRTADPRAYFMVRTPRGEIGLLVGQISDSLRDKTVRLCDIDRLTTANLFDCKTWVCLQHALDDLTSRPGWTVMQCDTLTEIVKLYEDWGRIPDKVGA